MTQKDIANLAGVSLVTVSNVINGNYKKVSKEKIELINQLIDQYHFVPNATARSLAKKESRIIGVVIPNVAEDDNFLQSPYNAEIVGVLEREIRNKGYYLMTRCVGSCTDVIPLLSSWNVDGVLFIGAFKEDAKMISSKVSLPTVFFDTYVQGIKIANVGTKDFKGGYIATQYLIEQGHQHIMFAGPEVHGQTVIPQRYQGYEQAMREAGLSDCICWQYTAYTDYDCGVINGQEIAEKHPEVTAVFASADILALGIMRGIRMAKKQVPDDVSIIGFDNLAECRYSDPQLTSISQNISMKAKLAAQRLFSMIEGKNVEEWNESVDVELIVRQSVKHL